LALTFFGLTPKYKMEIHKSMLITAHYSKGAFSVMDLYQMPVYLRNFYIKEFSDMKKREAAEVEKLRRKR
jgi:hypothetical protein